jgi:hypothetical protein
VALDRSQLAASLKKAMQRAVDEKMTRDQVAEELATAIHGYVVAAEVVGIAGQAGNQPFTQSGKGKVQ